MLEAEKHVTPTKMHLAFRVKFQDIPTSFQNKCEVKKLKKYVFLFSLIE